MTQAATVPGETIVERVFLHDERQQALTIATVASLSIVTIAAGADVVEGRRRSHTIA